MFKLSNISKKEKVGMRYFILLFLIATSAFSEVKPEKITKVDNVLWGFDFISEKDIILNARNGKMYKYNLESKKQVEITGLPSNIYKRGQGGLLDVFFYKDRLYFTFSEDLGDKKYTTSLMSAKLEGNKLTDSKILFQAKTDSSKNIHFGSRVLVKDDVIYMTVGDRDIRDRAQDLNYHNGKLLRLNLDGTAHKDNPFKDKGEVASYIYSYGHRNAQGLCFAPDDTLYIVEFGPRGGDEINISKKGANYGWPVVTHGREYWGPKIGEGAEKKGMEPPIKQYTPSISPSGCWFHKGDLYLANLSGKHIRKVRFENHKFKSDEVLLKDMDTRFRMVREGRDGRLYFSTDEGELFVLRGE